MKRLLAVVATIGLVALGQPATAALSGTGLSATASATESGSEVTVSYTATDASSRLIIGTVPGIGQLQVDFDVLNCSRTYSIGGNRGLQGSNCTTYNGLQISAKQGNVGTAGNSTITFAESFPNGFSGVAEKPYTYALIEFSENANNKFEVLVELAITGSAFQSTSNSSAEPQPVAFEGPLLRGVDRRSFAADTVSNMTIVGKRLSKVTSVTINGKEAAIESKSNTGLSVTIPALPSGRYDLVLETKGGRITVLGLVNIR